MIANDELGGKDERLGTFRNEIVFPAARRNHHTVHAHSRWC
jgi:hypothetical protein